MHPSRKFKNAVLYARGVTDRLERQLQAGHEYAAKNDLTIVAEVAEPKALPGEHRTPFAKLLEQIDAQHPEIVMVTELTRLSRRFCEIDDLLQQLADRHVQILCLADSTRSVSWRDAVIGNLLKLTRSRYAPFFTGFRV